MFYKNELSYKQLDTSLSTDEDFFLYTTWMTYYIQIFNLVYDIYLCTYFYHYLFTYSFNRA